MSEASLNMAAEGAATACNITTVGCCWHHHQRANKRTSGQAANTTILRLHNGSRNLYF